LLFQLSLVLLSGLLLMCSYRCFFTPGVPAVPVTESLLLLPSLLLVRSLLLLVFPTFLAVPAVVGFHAVVASLMLLTSCDPVVVAALLFL
jgi:hypothetical protein